MPDSAHYTSLGAMSLAWHLRSDYSIICTTYSFRTWSLKTKTPIGHSGRFGLLHISEADALRRIDWR